MHECQERVIAYASKTLNRAQRNYCVTKRELLAVVSFVKQFKHFLYGTSFLVQTDHASLIWLRNFKGPEGIIARWISILETYSFTIQHRSGTKHLNADGLSRISKRKCKNETCKQCFPTVAPENSNLFYPVQRESINAFRIGAVIRSGTDENDDSSQIATNWLENDTDISTIIRMKQHSDERPNKRDISGCGQRVKILWRLWDSLILKKTTFSRNLR